MADKLAVQLLERGDSVSVDSGCIVVTSGSGKPVPDDWLDQNRERLIIDLADSIGTLALEYTGYSVGNYGSSKAGGVTLRFVCLSTGKNYYTIFNVETKRARNTRNGTAGGPLPKGQFRVGKQSAFLRFWKTTGLPYRSLSEFHDYMGNLSKKVYTASIADGERLDKSTLRPLSLPDKRPITHREVPDNILVRSPDKETRQHQQPRGFHPISTTGQQNYGNTVPRGHGYTGDPTLSTEQNMKLGKCPACAGEGCEWCSKTGKQKSPQDQTTDEWLADYDQAAQVS